MHDGSNETSLGIVLNKGAEVVKNSAHGRWGRHHTDTPGVMDPLHKELPGLLLEQLHHRGLDIFQPESTALLWWHSSTLTSPPMHSAIVEMSADRPASRESVLACSRGLSSCYVTPVPMWPALSGTCCIPMDWKVLHHLPYSLDLSPCDFYAFGSRKKVLKGHRFRLTSRPWCQGLLCRGFIAWCISGMPASTLMGTIFNGLNSFVHNNPWMGLFEQPSHYSVYHSDFSLPLP
jgi:hypothetical protein